MIRTDQPDEIASFTIDEIQDKLAATENTNQRFQLYVKLVDELQKVDIPRAIEVCNEAVELAQQVSSKIEGCADIELADYQFHLAMLYALNGNYLKTVSIISEILPIIEENPNRHLLGRVYNVVGVAYGNLGNSSESIDYLMRALKIFQELGDQKWEAGVLNNFGDLYRHIQNHDWALKNLNMSLELAEKHNDKSLQGGICDSLCSVYLDSNDCNTALEYGLRAIELYQETGNLHAEAEVSDSIGDVYLKLGESQKALDYYQKALLLSEKTGNTHEEINALIRIGRYYLSKHQCSEVKSNLEHALEIAMKLETKQNIYECHDALMQMYKQCGNYQLALEHSEKSLLYYQQVHNEEQFDRIQSLAAKHHFETMQKDAEIYQLKNAALQEEINTRKKAQENLQELAIKDHLTGLYNRYYFFELSESSFRQVVAENLPLSIIMIDADNFKMVNDLYGHAAGDVVLKKMAATMQGCLRRGDIIARYGGDEFVILLPDTNISHAWDVAERLRTMVDEQLFQVEQNAIHITCSFGLAYCDAKNVENLEVLLKHADHAMYEAKESGRNRVKLWKKDREDDLEILLQK